MSAPAHGPNGHTGEQIAENSPSDLLKFFPCNPDSFVVRKSVGTERDEDGKLSAKYTTYSNEEITERRVQLHLDGKECLVLKPQLKDDTCWWAQIDLDVYKDPSAIKKTLSDIMQFELPLFPYESKSGGLHCCAFFTKPVPCSASRAQLAKWAALLGYPNAEIFPKPVSEGKKPFGIALPFFGQPEAFKAFKPQLYELRTNGDIPDYLKTDSPAGFENMTLDDVSVPGIKLPAGIDFEKLLREHKLIFGKREVDGGTSYDYHAFGVPPQPCLTQGSVHAENLRNPRCSRFFEKNGYVYHSCFDSDCQSIEGSKTIKALAALGIDFDSKKPEAVAASANPEPRLALVVQDLVDFKEAEFPTREPYMTLDEFSTPIFTARSLNEIFAWRGTGKTMAALGLGSALAEGGKFLNLQSTRKIHVLYVEGETPNAQLQEPAKLLTGAVARGYFRFITLDNQPNGIPALHTEAGRKALKDTIEALGDVEVAILDSISTLAWFPTNEEEEWLKLLAWFAHLRSKGLCIIFLHHAGKTGLQRGHSRAEDMLDVAIKLERPEAAKDKDHLAMNWEYDKVRGSRVGVMTLRVELQNGFWWWRTLEEEKTKLLKDYMRDNPEASSREVSKALPELGSSSTVWRLQRQLNVLPLKKPPTQRKKTDETKTPR